MVEVGQEVAERAGGLTHRYVLLGRFPYVRKDGRAIERLTWGGSCVVCSQPFQFYTGPEWARHMPRACKPHRPWLASGRGAPARQVWTRTLRRRALSKGSSRAP